MWLALSLLSAVSASNADSAALVRRLTAENRDVQRAAVEALIDYEVDVSDTLVVLFASTGRHDVQEHILLVFERTGARGLDALIRVAADQRLIDYEPVYRRLVGAFVAHGRDALPRLEKELRKRDSRLRFYIRAIVDGLGMPTAEYAHRLMTHDSAVLRACALLHFRSALNGVEASKLYINLMQSELAGERPLVYWGIVGNWSTEDVASAPEAYSEFVDGLLQLLRSDETSVVNDAIHVAAGLPTAEERLLLALERELECRRDSVKDNAPLMRAIVRAHARPSEAADRLLKLRPDHPRSVGQGLLEIVAKDIPDSAIPKMFAAAHRMSDRDYEWGFDLIARFGERAIPFLVEQLGSRDGTTCRSAARCLKAMAAGIRGKRWAVKFDGKGPVHKLRGTINALLHEATSRSDRWLRAGCFEAAFEIAPTDPRVRSFVESAIVRYSEGNAVKRSGVTHPAMAYLGGISPLDWPAWACDLVLPYASDPEHPLHDLATKAFSAHEKPPPPDWEEISGLLSDTRERDEHWAKLRSAKERIATPDLFMPNGPRNGLLRLIESYGSTPDDVVDALLAVMRSPVLQESQPERIPYEVERAARGEQLNAFRVVNQRRFVWDCEFRAVSLASRLLVRRVQSNEVQCRRMI